MTERTRQDMETALAKGHLWVAMANGRYWRLRRNGETRTWKRDAARFEIPCKAGLKSYCTVDNHNLNSSGWVISETQPKDWR